jgi:hypothetical protein
VLLTWTYQGNDDSGFELEMEDQTIGENFHTILVPGAVDSTGHGTTTVDSLTWGDAHNFRIRADHTDGTVSAYVSGAGYTPPLLTAPQLSVTPFTDSDGISHLTVSWSGAPAGGTVELRLTGDAFPDVAKVLVIEGNDVYLIPAGADGQGSLLDPGVRNNAGSYSYQIEGFSTTGQPTSWSSPKSGALPEGASPSISGTGSTNTSITFSWTGSADAATITVYSFFMKATVPGQTDLSFPSTAQAYSVGEVDAPPDQSVIQDLTFTLSSLAPGTTYHCVLTTAQHAGVGLVNGGIPLGFVQFDITTTGIAPTTPPAAPAFAHAMYDPSVPFGQVKLYWANTPNNETGYTIDRMIPIDTGGYRLVFVANTGADVTSYTDRLLHDNGPYQFRIYSRNAAGESADFAGAACVAIGGPDITADLASIWSHLRKIAAIPQGRATLEAGYFVPLGDQAGNWDIDRLGGQSVHVPTNYGYLPDGTATVTVSGHVYKQADVNYWLYGAWIGALGLDVVEQQIAYAKVVAHARGTTEGASGKAAWFMAGLHADAGIPIPTAIPNVAPARKPIDVNGVPLEWHVGNPPNEISGAD